MDADEVLQRRVNALVVGHGYYTARICTAIVGDAAVFRRLYAFHVPSYGCRWYAGRMKLFRSVYIGRTLLDAVTRCLSDPECFESGLPQY